MKKLLAFVVALLLFMPMSWAGEGMWIPALIDMFYSDMKTHGLKLKPSQIYSTNKSSLKDAIVQFDGGCTAELVSKQGLLLTNHHCGFDAIQQHSSLENDYLKHGFWAKNRSEELACPWMHVTFVKEMREVTFDVLKGTTEAMTEEEKAVKVSANIKALEAAAAAEKGYKAKIKPFHKGNVYYMLITQDYNDIRLVGAPPSAIGKYGGDTDNWVWPRHTGDFSVFRIYADEDNAPADYSEANRPYKPAHFLPISMKDKQEGDFTMVYGFPGRTDQHYSAAKLGFYMQQERPARIKMRETSLGIIKPAMNNSDEIRIKYASKQASIANAWKKWIGQLGGLRDLKALDKKAHWEKKYNTRTQIKEEWTEEFGTVLEDLAKLQEENQKYEFARALFIEYFFVGPEFLRFSYGFNNLANRYEELEAAGKLEAEIARLKEANTAFFKNYDLGIDQKIYEQLTPLYVNYMDNSLLPDDFAEAWAATGKAIFADSKLLHEKKVAAILENFDAKTAQELAKDPALQLAASLYSNYLQKVAPSYGAFQAQEEELMETYVKGALTMFPKQRHWSDANSTLRIAYGKLEGSAPHDGMAYLPYTTIDGVMQKYQKDHPDFDLPERFMELYEAKDFGPYTQNGELWVCFTASNHTTGGNSGSPVIDAKGRLMGINFDRSWESTMSDFMFDESRCRNIAVDIRYVLWVIDRYGQASWLIDEMKLVK